MATVSEALRIAFAHSQAGRAAACVSVCHDILRAAPACADALYLLGLALHQQGNSAGACEALDQAIRSNPKLVAAQHHLGCIRAMRKEWTPAADAFARAVELQPDLFDAHLNLGLVRLELAQPEPALLALKRAVQLRPASAEALYQLGNAHLALRQAEQAIDAYQQALERQPAHAAALNNLGNARLALGETEAARQCFERAIAADPKLWGALNNLANLLQQAGDISTAVACYRRVVAALPDSPTGWQNLGIALGELLQFEEAEAALRRALALEPASVDTHVALAHLFRDRQQPVAAEATYRRALELRPDHIDARLGLASVLRDQTQLDAALSTYREVLRLDPHNSRAHGNYLLALQTRPGITLAELSTAHAEFEARHTAGFRLAWTSRRIANPPTRRLRLGFVSPDLGQHPVGFLLVRGFEQFDRRELELFCYSGRKLPDTITDRFRRSSDQFHDVRGWSDTRLDEQIRRDEIDILYDLSGHTAQNRLLVFARKPAPLQATWVGYEGTTGLAAIDVLLADPHVIPLGSERHFRETVVRMPESYVCFDPPAEGPPIAAAPASTGLPFTFGCFNNPVKLNADVLAAWATILERVPGSRLFLKYRGLSDSGLQRRLLAVFAEQGIAPERISFEGKSSFADYLASYGRVDVALDPFPFCGGVTSCEALWMGVPVLTCPGETFASRHTLSFLTSTGLTDWVANDVNDYVHRAVLWSQRVAELNRLRHTLRDRMLASPLCDAPRFAQHFLAAQHEIVRLRESS